jgi:hypothetical protein
LGKNIKFYKGVQNWFKRINQYGESIGVNIEHYIISSGVKDIIDGSEIKDEFKKIFACQYYFDESGEAVWPSIAINYTQKTQYIFRISKGIYDETDNKKVNEKMSDRVVAYQNMIYFGDGSTDIPAMKLVKTQGGYSVAVHDGTTEKRKQSEKLLNENRVDFTATADYRKNSELTAQVCRVIDKIVAEYKIEHA